MAGERNHGTTKCYAKLRRERDFAFGGKAENCEGSIDLCSGRRLRLGRWKRKLHFLAGARGGQTLNGEPNLGDVGLFLLEWRQAGQQLL